MKRRDKERQEAIRLREKGVAVRQIAKMLKVSVGSVSPWVRDVKLTLQQRQELDKRVFESRHKFAANSINFARKLRKDKEERTKRFIAEAESEFKSLVDRPEFVYGLGLYAGEGRKDNRWTLGNTDAQIIAAAARFLKIVGWRGSDTICSVRIHPTCSVSRAIEFWKTVVPGANVKVYLYQDKRTGAGKILRGGYRPFGVCDLAARRSTGLLVKTLRWIEMMSA